MILLKPELSANLATGSKEAVLAALQQAIELEHSTIPPYLYALYSLDEKSNGLIARIIQSVVVEEMLHMTLACNLLNALGGNPVLDKKDFIPAYPGSLPGGVDHGLRVNLAPFSYSQLDTFLSIEEPENPLEFPLQSRALDKAKAADQPLTIGQFYTQICTQIAGLGDGAFSNSPRHQIGPGLLRESVIVTNVCTAKKAISVIIDQGEGTSTSPEEQVGGGYAHYYRFMEIKMGRKLVKLPNSKPHQFAYAGEHINLDLNGVFPVPTNPTLAGYATNPAASNTCATFNYTYTNLLRTLHDTYNGSTEKLSAAIGLMMSLKSQAKAMMSGIPNPGLMVGPSFEYQPTNP